MTTKDIIETIKKDRMVRKYTDPNEILKLIEAFVEGLKLSVDSRFEVEKKISNKELEVKIKIL